MSSHTSLPVLLLTAMIDGARGDGTLTWLSSWPFEVLTKSRSPMHDGRGVRQVVRIGADLLHHVERPDDVGVELSGELLVLERAVVLVVAEPADVETEEHRAVAHVVEPLAFDQRRRGDALKRPVVGASRLELRRASAATWNSPVRFAEGHQHAAVARLFLVAHQLVVGADEHHAARDDGIAVALRAEIGHPLHVLLGLDVPLGWADPWHSTPCCGRVCRPTWASRALLRIAGGERTAVTPSASRARQRQRPTRTSEGDDELGSDMLMS